VTNNPQLLGIVLYIVAMLCSPVRRVHFCVWLPQLGLVAAGIFMQTRRMSKDQRYAKFLARTHWIPFYALATGRAPRWTWLDTATYFAGMLPGAVLLITGQFLADTRFGGVAVKEFFVPACVLAQSYDCHTQMLATTWLYIVLLVVAALVAQHCKFHLLPAGRGEVDGTRCCDIEGCVQSWVGGSIDDIDEGADRSKSEARPLLSSHCCKPHSNQEEDRGNERRKAKAHCCT